MKYDILKDFRGSPDGRFTVQYLAGQKEVELTDSLAAVAVAEKWARKIEPKPERKHGTKTNH